MATQQIADAGGTTVSFSNTPQAKDDAFYFSEDSTGVLILNVLANDLGGAAKLLYSIDNSVSASTATKTPAPSDLLIRDTTYSSTNDGAGLAGTTDTSLLGARIWIASDGTIHYNTADINTLLQSLAQGQILTDKLTYAIQLGNGTLSWATTTVQFTGTNDKPVIGAATLVGAVTEDAHTPTETATGTIAFGDVDLTDVHLVSAVFKGTDYSGQLGSLNAVKTTDTTGTGTGGQITWTFTAADSALDKLAAGQVVHETYTVTLDDQHGGVVTRDVVITITGTNDKPVIGAATLVGAVTEDAHTPTETATGTIAFGDVDLTDVHLVSAVFKGTDYSGQLGSLAAVKTTDTTGTGTGGQITWTFTAADSALDKLAAGQVVHETYTVTLDDQHGGVITRDVVITIHGTNDNPTISGHTDGDVSEDGGVQGSGGEAGTESTSGTVSFADVDLTDSHTVSALAQGAGYVGTFTPTIGGGQDSTGTGSGTVGWSFSVDDSAIDHLGAGESLVQKYDVKVDDGHGGTATQTVTVTIHGTNDNPTISGHTDGDVSEDGGVQGSGGEAGTESTSGTVSFADVDLTDSHTVSALAQGAGYVGTFTPTIGGGQDSTGTGSGTVGWSFSVDDSAIDHLGAGESLVQKYDVKVDDGHGGTATQTVTVTIHGTNDNPTISGHTDGDVSEDGGVQGSGGEAGTESTSGTVSFADVDLTDSHTVSALAQGAGYVGTFTPTIGGGQDSTGTGSGTVGWSFSVDDSAIDHLGAGESLVQKYDVKVDDGHGGTATQTVTVTIHGTNDNPTISGHTDGDVSEDGGVQGSGGEAGTESTSGTVSFADVDLTDSHTVSALAQGAGYVGTFTPTIGGGQDSTGTGSGTVGWSFSVDDSAIDHLGAGESLVQKYDVKVDDGHGGTATQTVTVTIHGTNDNPTISGHTDGDVSEDGGVQGSGGEAGTESTSGTVSFADVDLTDSHTVSALAQGAGYVGTFTPTIGGGQDSTGTGSGTVGWSFSVDDSAIDHLGAGESLVQKYDVKVDDGHGGTATQTVTVTIHGTNDNPTISGHTDGDVSEDGGVQGSGGEAGTESTSGTVSFADVDLTDSHTVSALAQGAGYVGTFTPTIGGGQDSTGTGSGTVGWSFSVDDSAIDHLGAGESLVQKYDVKVDDGHGGTATQTVTVTIHGTNDNPTISGHTDGDVSEDGGVQGSGGEAGTESTSGTVSFADVDLTDSHTVSALAQGAGYVGTFTPTIGGGQDSTGTGSGTVGWSFSVDDSAIDHLGAGESLVQKYDVKVDDGHGGTATQTVTVTIHGTNDNPTISGHTDGDVSEDGGVQGSGGEAGTESTSGTVSFADVDLTDSHTVSALAQGAGYVGTFTPTIGGGQDSTGTGSGTVGWSFSVDDSAIDHLGAGESLVQKYDVKVDDGHGGTATQTVTVTIHGTNDNPTISGHTDGDVSEDGGVQGSGGEAGTESTSGTVSFADVDLTDSHTVSALAQGAGYVGTFTPTIGGGQDSTGTGSGTVGWSFSVDDSAIDHLGAGESLVQKYDVKVDDGHGGTATQTVTVTIHGTNDNPTISGHTDGDVSEDGGVQGSGGEAGTESTSGTVSFADVDLTDSHTVSALAQGAGYVGTFTPTIGGGQDSTGTGSGTVGWSFSVDDSAIDHLGAGESLVQKYDVKVDDGHGGTATQTVTVTIHGTNDNPTISGHTDGDVSEDGGVQGSGGEAGTESTSGTVSFADVDLTDSHTVSALAQGAGYVGTFTPTIGGGQDSTGTGSGTVGWSFSVDDSAIDHLGAGESLVQKYDVKVDDGHGGTATQTVTVTIHGTNDNPTISATATGSVTEDTPAGATETASGTVSFGDVDLTDTHTVSASFVSSTNAGGVQLGLLTAAKTLDTSGGTGGTGTWNYSVNNSAIQFLAAGQTIQETYQVTVADNHGGSTSQNVVVTITGTNDNPTMSATATGSVTEDTPAGATETASGTVSFGDVDLTDTHTVSASFVSSTNAGGVQLGLLTAAKTLDTSGGTGGTGTWNYSVNNSAIQFLAAGQTIQETYQVTVADNHGGSTSQNVVVTITGTNDNPTMSATATGSVTEDTPAGATETASGTVSFGDVDLTDTHTVSASFVSSTNAGGVQLGLLTAAKTLDTSGGTGGTGTWNYSVNNSAIQFLAAGQTIQETYQVTVADNHGGSTSQNVVVTITGTNDAPFIDLNSGTAGTSTSINYTAGSAATAIAPSATVTDIDSADFNGGKLTIAFTANGTSADQLTIQNQGTGAGQIGVSGSNVTYQGTTIGTFTGGTNGSNLVITFNANATQAAAAALADHILYSNATSPTIAKTVTYTLVDGDGTANGGTDTGTATATINVTGGDTTAPDITLITGVQGNNNAPSTLIIRFSETGMNHTFFDSTKLALSNGVTLASTTGTWGTTTDGSGNTVDTYTLQVNKPNNGTTYTATFSAGAFKDGAGNLSTGATQAGLKPAGTAGEPINLALTDPSDGQTVTVTVKGVPSGWIIDGATQNADGSWTMQSNAIHELTVTTSAAFVGAAVLDVHLNWTNADGTTGNMFITDNVEAYAQGSPIFAWSGDDVVTGSTGHDLFVFSQPIGNDTVHNFDAAADQIDLIGYNGLASFGDLQTHIADDAHGNAVITLADGQSITLDGVHSSALGTGNFVFDQTPVVNNPGTMTLGDGSLLPLSGAVNNSGLISLNSAGDDTLLQVIEHGVTLEGGGQVVLSDSAANIISGTGPDVTLINIDNTISGAGKLGDGMLGLDNRGTIIASGTNALVIDTGGSVVINSGTLAATGSGGLVVAGGVANSGMIEANGGNVVIHGQVTGDGDASIGNLSKLEFGAASSTDVTFAQNAAGTLELDDSFDYSGRISGITNDDKLDLNDILFGAGTTVGYQASQDGSGGTLTVSDGAHNTTLHLLGTYDANGFKLADDGQGHTVVTYNPAEFTLTGVSGGTSEFAV